jgi:hypothetical protein
MDERIRVGMHPNGPWEDRIVLQRDASSAPHPSHLLFLPHHELDRSLVTARQAAGDWGWNVLMIGDEVWVWNERSRVYEHRRADGK